MDQKWSVLCCFFIFRQNPEDTGFVIELSLIHIYAYLKALLLGFGIAGGAGVMIRILSRHRRKVREQ